MLGAKDGLNKGFYQLMQELPQVKKLLSVVRCRAFLTLFHLHLVTQERLLIADIAVSSAEGIFEVTRDYVTERKAFKKRIADFQVTKHKLVSLSFSSLSAI